MERVCNNSYPVSSVSSVTWTDNGTVKAVAGCTQLGTVNVVTCVWFMMKTEDYTFAEMADILFFYGRANGNAHEARRLYKETFPNRRLPCSRTFSRIAQRLQERGTFIPVIEGGRPWTAKTVQQEQRILAHVAANPGTSKRRISSAEGVHRSTVWRILHEDQLYPYHLQSVQGLKPEDLSRRVRFCQWCLEQCVRHPQILWKLLFTNEEKFTRDGIFNFHVGTCKSTRHSRGTTSDHVLNKCLDWYRWGWADWSSPFTRAVDGAYVPGIFGTTDAIHFAWCAWWCSLAVASRHVFHAWWGSTTFQPHSTSIPEWPFPWEAERA
jgi:hypothetical protein